MKYNPSDFLPQKPPMQFITAIESFAFENQSLVTRVDVRDDDLLFQKNINGIHSTVALEYMAQSVACCVGVQKFESTGKFTAGVGFVLGSRDLHISIPKFNVNESYYVHVLPVFGDANMAAFECKIYDNKNSIVADGILNVFRPDDIKDFMEKMS